jgi:hypothetical protein
MLSANNTRKKVCFITPFKSLTPAFHFLFHIFVTLLIKI